MSKARSGLGSVKRDWSSNGVLHEPRSSQEIAWPPTQAPQPAAPSRKLTGSELRLKAIQEALAGYPPAVPPPLAKSSVQNKRASPTAQLAAEPQPKRARQLPPDWPGTDALSRPTLSAKPPSGYSRTNSKSAFNSPASSSGTSAPKKIAPIFLSQEQTQILKLVQDGDSVFYTGSAGTGKSVLLREIIKTLRKKYAKTPDAVAITASTGIAACNIGGVTIHSFSGIGLGIEPAEELVAKIRKNKKSMISMVDGDLFDKLEKIATIIRDVGPFGGIQVIVTGDFFQLPPVTKGVQQVKFAFEAETWKKTVKHTFNLTKVFRQSDQTFVNMLNEMRFGNLSQKSIQSFKSLSREIEYDDGLGPTELFPRREDVERSNSTRMSRLRTTEETYASVDGGSISDPNQREKMLSNFMAPYRLVLRIDAQVMLIKNVDETLVNGSMGRVLRFVDPAIYGTELDAELMAGGGPRGGVDAGVVGASASNSGVGGDKKKNAAASAGVRNKPYPVVEFMLPHGGRRRVLVMPEVWKVELPSGEVQISRTQLPLILAWAMSIHKSQGQTLDRVKVDLGKVFEKGVFGSLVYAPPSNPRTF
ncbi:hypothetical protein NLJ89_g1922 [Agrocybe chaxingu]|uniref:ATP-dependent DNA helicase n=1 Tax=Agrocybe chaxingu TaxID=84603 RepID=A0A9W8MZ47_9AGAR|nr:hypothetical protein NLJ89_g1922 [Agrocybe chaxingu]